MMLRLLLIALIGFSGFISSNIHAQGFVFGPKGGLTLAYQKWNSFQKNTPLFSYHAAAFIESYDEDNPGSLYAQLGYHVLGTGSYFPGGVNRITNQTYSSRSSKEKFSNVYLSVGAKKRLKGKTNIYYYGFGIRGEYNVATNFDIYDGLEEGLKKFTYGVTVSAGMEFPLSDLVGSFIELSIQPDIAKQVYLPSSSWTNPYTGELQSFQELGVFNTAIEFSVGMRFFRKIEYIN